MSPMIVGVARSFNWPSRRFGAVHINNSKTSKTISSGLAVCASGSAHIDDALVEMRNLQLFKPRLLS